MSRPVVRLAALAGAAAVVFGVATPMAAATDRHTATVHSSYASTVRTVVADRPVTVRMPTTNYTASDDHAAAVQAAAGTPVSNPTTDPNSLPGFNPLTGETTSPVTTGPAYTQPANVTTQSTGGATISIGVAATLISGGLLIYGIKKKEIKKGWAFVAVGFGVFTAATIVGTLYGQIADTGASTATNILGSFG